VSQLAERRHKERELVAAHVDRDQRRRLKALAAREDRSVSSVIRSEIAAYLERADGDGKEHSNE
jgi:predicted transcriptional regulator